MPWWAQTPFYSCNFWPRFYSWLAKGHSELMSMASGQIYQKVLDEVRCFAMFGGGKVVVVQNADAFITKYRESLEDYALKPSDSATLVFRLASFAGQPADLQGHLKNGCDRKVRSAKGSGRNGSSSGASRAHQLAVAIDAARLLADYVGDDLARLDNELAKLALTVNDSKVRAQEHCRWRGVSARAADVGDGERAGGG